MCTAMALSSGGGAGYFGRTMDFSHPLVPHVYFVSSGYAWKNIATGKMMQDSYSFITIGQELSGILAFFDGVNEWGLAGAALYFAGYAQYNRTPPKQAPIRLAAYDFLHYILGNFASIEELRAQIGRIDLAGVTDPLTKTAAPLHWIVCDKRGRCVVIEQTEQGMQVFENPLGVLSNSPDFPWHMTNLRNYLEASPQQTEAARWGDTELTAFGQGGGTAILPGGYTPPARFVRTAYLKTHVPKPNGAGEAVTSFYQVMKNVSIPKGAVVTARGTDDYTQYTAFIDINRREYYVNTYDNPQIRKVGFPQRPTPAALTDLGKIQTPPVFPPL